MQPARYLCCLIILGLIATETALARPNEVDIVIDDSVANHIHVPRETFTIIASSKSDGNERVDYFWRDVLGRPLTPRGTLPANSTQIIESPVNPPPYLELAFIPVDRNMNFVGRDVLEVRSFGFAVMQLPERRPEIVPSARFGVVHASLDDPFVPGWVKTSTWLTTGPDGWWRRIEERRVIGAIELPIIIEDEWSTDDTVVVSDALLDRLTDRAATYFSAHRETKYWEAGIEENLTSSYDQPLYWTNLALKAQALRAAANRSNPDVKLIYQVAELRLADITRFLRSSASRHFDILSLHPYDWPDFRSPETWLPEFLSSVRQTMGASGDEMPIWFTEVGAPVRGNSAGGFFGYPLKGAEVDGLSLLEAAVYMVRMHVVAFQNGVEKIFWYNHKDRGSSRERAEDHFGMVDYWGFPKPSYVAYEQLRRTLGSMPSSGGPIEANDVLGYNFASADREITVAWSTSGEGQAVDARDLVRTAPGNRSIRVEDLFGTVLPGSVDSVVISNSPVYIIVE
jgi:hypothetical protein